MFNNLIQDKSSNVRKAAVQLLNTLLQVHILYLCSTSFYFGQTHVLV